MTCELQDINSDLYVVEPGVVTTQITLAQNYGIGSKIFVSNLTTEDLYVTASASPETLVYPSSSSSPVPGKIVPPGGLLSFNFQPQYRVLNFLQDIAGSGLVAVNVGPGV